MSELRQHLDMTNHLGQIEGITSTGVNAACKAFGDANNRSVKTPISLLQEICTKCLLAPPIYDLAETIGRTHEPQFVYKCTLSTNSYMYGKGASKKKAKHAAALGVLNHIVETNRGQNDGWANSLEKLM